jgi:hypothetical protein
MGSQVQQNNLEMFWESLWLCIVVIIIRLRGLWLLTSFWGFRLRDNHDANYQGSLFQSWLFKRSYSKERSREIKNDEQDQRELASFQ